MEDENQSRTSSISTTTPTPPAVSVSAHNPKGSRPNAIPNGNLSAATVPSASYSPLSNASLTGTSPSNASSMFGTGVFGNNSTSLLGWDPLTGDELGDPNVFLDRLLYPDTSDNFVTLPLPDHFSMPVPIWNQVCTCLFVCLYYLLFLLVFILELGVVDITCIFWSQEMK